MPKKPPKNAFFFYMLHFKDEEARRGHRYPGGLPEISNAASASWKNMTAQERGPFEKKAKDAKLGPRQEVEKFTSQGIPLSLIDKEQRESENAHRTMLRTIRDMVQDGITDNTIASQELFFISGNYFINANESYLPAEIAIVKFTFESGIVKKFHTYVNPEKVPLGYQFIAKENSEKTHRLPIPPNAKGERNYQIIIEEIDKFLGNKRDPPPVFTMKEEIPIIESFMQQLCDYREGNNSRYRVYPLHQLFYDIKEEAVKNSIDGVSFRSIHIAEAHLNRDHYAYLNNTACNYHEENDVVKFCALANVQKWAFIFADHICVDLNVTLISGQHFPPEIDLSHLNQTDNSMSSSKLNDTQGTYTAETENKRSSYAAPSNHRGGRPKSPDSSSIDEDFRQRPSNAARSNHWGERPRSPEVSSREDDFRQRPSRAAPSNHWGGRPKSPDVSSRDEDFPSLGSHSRRGGQSKKRSDQRDTNNPWNTSSSSSSSDIQLHSNDGSRLFLGRGSVLDSSIDSSVSRGMGRGSLLFRNESGFGRGRNHNDRPSERDRSGSSHKDRSGSSHKDRSGSSHKDRSDRYHPWEKELKSDRHRKSK